MKFSSGQGKANLVKRLKLSNNTEAVQKTQRALAKKGPPIAFNK